MEFSPRFWNNSSYGIHSTGETQWKYDLDENNFLPLLFFVILFMVVIYDTVCLFWCLRNFGLWQIGNTSSEHEAAELRWEPNNRLNMKLNVIYEERSC